VTDLLRQLFVISVDAEGVNLGKEGPLTLLQIGTIDGQVYLFDVHMNPDIFRRGKLIEICFIFFPRSSFYIKKNNIIIMCRQ
jgi:hypothetical protein